MEVKKMTAEHIPQIAEIEREAFPTHPWSEALFYDELADGSKHYLVIIEGEELLAYGGFAQIFDEGHIMNIAVRKDYRKQGIGRQLMEQLLKIALELGITAMTLEVAVENTPAINLYQSEGFVSYGVRPNYYGMGEHAEILWKAMDR